MNNIRNEILWFLVPTFILTYGLGFVTLYLGGMDKFPLMTVSMYVPALVVILLYKLKFNKPVFKGNDLGLNFKGFPYWILGVLMVLSIIALSFIISIAFKPALMQSPEIILQETEKTGLGVGNWMLNLLLIFGINTIMAPIINILMFLGEEIGWRGFLFPRLIKLYTPKMSFILCGTIWALWHAFAIMLGFNYPSNPFIGIVFMIVFCIPLGVILQYIYLKSKSIISAALAHGVVNWTASNFIMFVLADPQYDTFIWGPTGIIGIGILWIVAIPVYKSVSWNEVLKN